SRAAGPLCRGPAHAEESHVRRAAVSQISPPVPRPGATRPPLALPGARPGAGGRDGGAVGGSGRGGRDARLAMAGADARVFRAPVARRVRRSGARGRACPDFRLYPAAVHRLAAGRDEPLWIALPMNISSSQGGATPRIAVFRAL